MFQRHARIGRVLKNHATANKITYNIHSKLKNVEKMNQFDVLDLQNEPCRKLHPLPRYIVQEIVRGIPQRSIETALSGLGVPKLDYRDAMKEAEDFLHVNEFADQEKEGVNQARVTVNSAAQAVFGRMMPPADLFCPDMKERQPFSGLRIIDNMMPEYVIKELARACAMVPQSFGKIANPYKKHLESGFWSSILIEQSDSNRRIDVARTTEFKSLRYLDRVWSHITSFIGSRNLVRAYTNSQTFGTDPTVHRDDPMIYRSVCGTEGAPITVLIYLNETWDIDWGGETTFFDDKGEVIASVMPKFGRIICFDGTIQHGARPLSRCCPVKRDVLVFKSSEYTLSGKDDLYALVSSLVFGVAHSGRAFFTHLSQTAGILLNLGMPTYLVHAALCHSMYGTEYFKIDGKPIEREALRGLIGEKAERLVHLFCSLEKRTDRLIERSFDVSDDDFKDLLLIEYANLAEQMPHVQQISKSDKYEQIRNLLSSQYGLELPVSPEAGPVVDISPGSAA